MEIQLLAVVKQITSLDYHSGCSSVVAARNQVALEVVLHVSQGFRTGLLFHGLWQRVSHWIGLADVR